MRFAHIADVHLGGWKQKPLQDLNFQSFRRAIELCIEQKLDFVLIAGDLFDSAYPPIEILKDTFGEFKKLKEAKIPCFIIAGSHDYSVSGKTFLDVLEKAGFCHNVENVEEKNEILYQTKKNVLKIAAISNNEDFDEELIQKLVQNYQKKYDIPAHAQIISFLNPIFEEASSSDFDILFLPEHFIDLTGIEDYLNIESGKELTKAYQYFTKKLNRPIAVVFANKQNGRNYNSTFLFYPNGEKEIYNKKILMFIGEVFPFKNGQSYFAFGKELKTFKTKNIPFVSAMCSEIHYPSDLYKAKKRGIKFIYTPTSNRWAGQGIGLYQYLFSTNHLKKIMSVWLKTPIINVGRNDFPGIYSPDGKTRLIEFESQNQDYQIFSGEIRL